MTTEEFAQLLAKRIIKRALEEENPVAYFGRAVARACFLSERAKITNDPEGELLEFGREFGLLAQGVEKRN
jgi:hypothetical protein